VGQTDATASTALVVIIIHGTALAALEVAYRVQCFLASCSTYALSKSTLKLTSAYIRELESESNCEQKSSLFP
jgi:hypothetical protein